MAIIFNPFDGKLAQHPGYIAEFAKLGAGINIQSDWNATSGQAQILNKPDLSIYMSNLIYDPGGISANVFDLSNHTGSIDGGTFT